MIKFLSKANRPPAHGTADGVDIWELGGSAVANSLVSLFDANTLLGTTPADATGAWTFESGFDSISCLRAMATDAAGNTSPLSLPFNVARGAQEVETRQELFALAMIPSLTGAESLSVNDTADHIINAAEVGRCRLQRFGARGRRDRHGYVQRYVESSGCRQC